MTQLDKLLQPLEGELLYSPRQYAELSAQTRIELLDGQEVFHSGVLYIGTAKQAAALLKAPPTVEPGCFLLVTQTAAPVVQSTPLQRQMTWRRTSAWAAGPVCKPARSMRPFWCRSWAR